MNAALPVRAVGVLFVTIQTRPIAGFRCNTALGTKRDIGLGWFVGTLVAEVILASAVTAGAGRCARIRQCAVAGLTDRQQIGPIGFVMTGRTGRIAFQHEVLGHRLHRNRASHISGNGNR